LPRCCPFSFLTELSGHERVITLLLPSREQRFDERFDNDTVFKDIDPRSNSARLLAGV
jgi:hypothetical protein